MEERISFTEQFSKDEALLMEMTSWEMALYTKVWNLRLSSRG